jgi:polar amino acid transport system substrate-binding protein
MDLMRLRCVFFVVLGAMCGAAGIAGAAPAAAETPAFRVCADPDNLPFTSAAAGQRGLYLDLAEAIAGGLGARLEIVWWANQNVKRAIRENLLTGRCDAYFGLPHEPDFMGPRLILSKPFLETGFAVVAPKEARVRSLADLAGKKIGVAFASTPHNELSIVPGMDTATFLTVDGAMQALAEKRIDFAYLWGPLAGYVNQARYRNAFDLISTADRGMRWSVVVAFKRGNEELRDRVDAEIGKLTARLGELQTHYGFPTAAPIRLAAAAPSLVRLAAAGDAAVAMAAAAAVPGGGPAAGKDIFNNLCSHCHGPNAVGAERRVDLRRLTIRHGDDAAKVFATTVRTGRVAKGMPVWVPADLSDADMTAVKAFLDTVQTKE